MNMQQQYTLEESCAQMGAELVALPKIQSLN